MARRRRQQGCGKCTSYGEDSPYLQLEQDDDRKMKIGKISTCKQGGGVFFSL